MSPTSERPERRPKGDDGGFSLIELVVALSVLMVLALAVGITLTDGLGVSKASRQRVAAANLAAREIEIVRNQFASSDTAALAVANTGNVTNANPLGVSGPSVVDGTAYTVQRDVQWLPIGNGTSACDGGSLVSYPSLRVSVAVTWPNMRTTKPVVSQTLLTPLKGTLGSTTLAFIAVKVTNAAGGPSSNVDVQLVGPGGTFVHTTDSSGCSVTQVGTAGSYTATLDMPGWVDQTGVQQSTKSPITVSAGTLARTAMTYAKAATLDITVATDAGFALPTPLPAVNYLQPNVAQAIARRTLASTGATTSAAGLWPTLDGYSAWSGGCADSDPAGAPTNGSQAPPTVVPAGGTGAAVARLAPVDLTVTDALGNLVTGSTVTAVSQSCAATVPDRALTLGVTDGSGNLKTSLPYGSWQLSATVAGAPRPLDAPIHPVSTGVTTLALVVS